jgi:hypothetical protein
MGKSHHLHKDEDNYQYYQRPRGLSPISLSIITFEEPPEHSGYGQNYV